MTDRTTVLNSLVSRPWESDGLHCWEFVCQVRRALFKCDALPPVGTDLVEDTGKRHVVFASHPARLQWTEIETPHDGDVVMMTRRGDLHAGIFLITDGRGLVWHCDAPHGVIADTLMELTQLRRWKPTFYRLRS